MMIKKILYIALTAAIAFGCSKEDVNNWPQSGEVSFRATMTDDASQAWGDLNPLGGKAASRASDGAWTVNDRVGIFVYNGVQTLNANAQYKIDNITTGVMSAVEAADKMYPPSGTSIDYYAYYPYSNDAANVSGTTYKVDVTDQSDLTKIDLMWAKAIGQMSNNVQLNFSHQLTKLVFNIEAGKVDVFDLTGMTATLTGANTKADFDLKTGTFSNSTTADITLNVTAGATSDKATITAIVAPTADLATGKVIFTAEGKSFVWNVPATEWIVGKSYTYDISMGEKLLFETVSISAGTFMMGSPTTEPNRFNDETQHSVTLSQGFKLSKYEITNAQYCLFLNENNIGSTGIWSSAPTYNTQTLIYASSTGGRSNWGVNYDSRTSKWVPASGKDDFPVIYVTWYGAMEYAQWAGGSLPTEAQWEYACRAGTSTAYSFGADATDTDDYCWYNGNSSNEPKSVGQKLPNAWSLYDMHGNVCEWCLDSWDGSNNYTSLPSTDPLCTTGSGRVMRGGSWVNYAQHYRSAYRSKNVPTFNYSNVGFRVALP